MLCRLEADIVASMCIQEREMQSALTTPRDTSTNDEGSPLPTFSLLSMVSGNSQGYLPANFDELHPLTWQAMQLWQIFVQNVDPMVCSSQSCLFFSAHSKHESLEREFSCCGFETVLQTVSTQSLTSHIRCQNKILHIPTAQVTVYTAINRVSEASPAVCCLLFSIYFSAITTLTPEETKTLLRKDKSQALNEFRFGLETSLAKANFLENPTLLTLQALGLFLVSQLAFHRWYKSRFSRQVG